MIKGDVGELSHSLTYMLELLRPKDDTCYLSGAKVSSTEMLFTNSPGYSVLNTT